MVSLYSSRFVSLSHFLFFFKFHSLFCLYFYSFSLFFRLLTLFLSVSFFQFSLTFSSLIYPNSNVFDFIKIQLELLHGENPTRKEIIFYNLIKSIEKLPVSFMNLHYSVKKRIKIIAFKIFYLEN